MTDSTTDDAIRAWLLADSDRRDREQERLLNNWHAGWRAAELKFGDQYEKGFADGLMAYKAARHAQLAALETEQRRAIPPSADDYQGGPVAPW